MKDKNNSPSFQILNSSLNSKNKIYLITSEITTIIIIIIIIIKTTIIIIIIIIIVVIVIINQINTFIQLLKFLALLCDCGKQLNQDKIWQRRTKVLVIYQV